MCVITILHCTPCKSRRDMSEEGLIITKDWHAQLLGSLDIETIPFRRCIEAKVHALSISRSDTLEYPRCRNVEVKHLAVTENICFRCSTRRKIQNLAVMRRLYEDQSAAWGRDERRNAEIANEVRRSIEESPGSVAATVKEASFCAPAGLLTPMTESWAHRLRKQVQPRKLANVKETERLARAEEEEQKKEEQKKEKKRARLASVQQHLARVSMLRGCPVTEDDTEQIATGQGQYPLGLRSVRAVQVTESVASSLSDEMVSSQVHEKVPRPISSQGVPALPYTPSSAAATRVGPYLPSSSKVEARVHAMDPAIAVKVYRSGEGSSVGAATHSVCSWASMRGLSTLRAEAPEFASLRGFPSSLGPESLRAEASEFKPLRQIPPTEPRMMRAPSAPRAMREGSLRRPSIQARQGYFSACRYASFRGRRD